jgi:predicted HTH transcriptional regulator
MKLTQLIAQGESETLEFKLRIISSEKIAQTFVAFANTGGGVLLIGVKDNGKILGIDAEEEMHMIDAAVDLYTTPKVEYNKEIIPLPNNKQLLLLTILASINKPHFAKKIIGPANAFVRILDENHIAPKPLINLWKLQKKEIPLLYKHSPAEEKIFEVLRKESATLKTIAKNARLPYFKLIKDLSQLIEWQIIGFQFRAGQIFYYLIL